MRLSIFLVALLSSLLMQAQSPSVEISTKNGSKWEKSVAERVQDLLNEYDLSKWIFTNKVIVEDNVIPHSHPILTLNTKNQSNKELLSTFIHEQLHWYVDENTESEKKAIAEFRVMYDDVPVGNREGARDEYSTYLHLIVCYLEYRSMVELVGQPEAERIMLETNHYKWIYRTVLKDETKIKGVLVKHNLNLVD